MGPTAHHFLLDVRKRIDEFVLEALEELVDDLPTDVVYIKVSNDLELLWPSGNVDDDRTIIPFHPLPANVPQHLPKIRRSQLTEIDRLGVHADHTAYQLTPGETPVNHVVFRYYTNKGNITGASLLSNGVYHSLQDHTANAVVQQRPPTCRIPLSAGQRLLALER